MQEDLNWGKTVVDADADAISVAIVDDVVGCFLRKLVTA
jgi:hypothetical protein